ncbi:hypothetical protein [Corynebacterium sputi]|uniref:hypothetical protein n=1 Tax=Corynebacterium sputi TaxID=489915 RepID=UPI00041DE505|nr:hypothetical protein [Corynebacterium sputi]
MTVEKHWGDPTRRQPREVFARGEKFGAIVMLTIGALAALSIEVIYLGTRISVGEISIPLPWTVLLAYLVNLIITNTALLWTTNRTVAAIPVIAWSAVFMMLLAWPSIVAGGNAVFAGSISTIALLVAGIFGGSWPLRHSR